MIVRFILLFTFFIISCSCGTSQGPKYLENNSGFVYHKLSDTDKARLAEEVKLKYEKLLGNSRFSVQIFYFSFYQILFYF